MNWIEALILGVIQGLTEFLPVSSSGHLEIGKHLLGADVSQSLEFTVVVHGATVLSTVVVFWKDIVGLFRSFFTFKKNEETSFVWKIVVSMIPVGIVGVLFKDEVEQFFNGNMHFVGAMLIVTSALLALTMLAKNRGKQISYLDSFIIGIAQAVAVLPGISRSGATIATGLLLGNKKEEVAKFSFLMVIIPILGANLKELFSGEFGNNQDISAIVLLVGFFAAFISGLFACRWMISIVKRGNLYYFALYCLVIGSIALIFG
jgi:undecaprenyl-diphosphatase